MDNSCLTGTSDKIIDAAYSYGSFFYYKETFQNQTWN